MRFVFNPKLFNPLHWHLEPLLYDHSVRFIHIEGGSSAAKTFTICQGIVLYIINTKRNAIVFRRFHVHIENSVYASFKQAIEKLELTDYFKFQEDYIEFKPTGAYIVFKGLDNEENIKGIEDFDIVYNNEWNQFLEAHWKQQRKRLRGRPNQKFICDWNPVSAKLWLYENWIDQEKWVDLPLEMDCPSKYSALNPEYAFKRINDRGNMVSIKVTYRDNFWIVGHPSGSGGFVDQATLDDFELDRLRDSAQYRVYANGERGIIRTGGEYWKMFDEGKHVKQITPTAGSIHVTLDNNVVPYVTVSIWQVFGRDIRQVHEIPCRAPDNNAPKAARRFITWLKSHHEKNGVDMLYLYGDPSANARSTVDEDSASFFDKFIQELQKAGVRFTNRVGKKAPEVALRAAFINEIYETGIEGYNIQISDTCRVSIDDYSTVKEAPDGSMLKVKIKDKETGQSYEPNGHFSDAKAYFIVELLKDIWIKWKAKKGNKVSWGYLR